MQDLLIRRLEEKPSCVLVSQLIMAELGFLMPNLLRLHSPACGSGVRQQLS